MIYDTIIVGSGAAGLSAAVYAARAELKFIVIEKIYMGTGQIAESERVDNYLGLYGENGFDLGEKFVLTPKLSELNWLRAMFQKLSPKTAYISSSPTKRSMKQKR